MARIDVHLPDDIADYEGELRTFLQAMVNKLYENRHKGKWDDVDLKQIMSLMEGERLELLDALADNDCDAILSECADIANFALIASCVAIKGTANPFAARAKVGRPWEFVEWALVQETDMCILWPFRARVGPNKEYGFLSKGQSPFGNRVHRVVCCMAHGEPPHPDSQAAHFCGNSLCINKRHVRWASPTENSADKLDHGTLVTPVLLSWEAADDIRDRWAQGERVAVMAKEHGVSVQSIYKIINSKAYAEHKRGRNDSSRLLAPDHRDDPLNFGEDA